MPPSMVAPSLAAHFPPGRRFSALPSRAPTIFLVLLLLHCSSCPMDAEAAIANVYPPAVGDGSIGKPSGVRSDVGKGRRRMDDTPDESPINAQKQMQTFFDTLLKLQHHYGTDVITVRDATETYPILDQTYEASREDCPFEYIPWQPDNWEGGTPNHRKLDDRPRPCFTPIVTIHDRIANSFNFELPDVLLLSGLDSPEEMDLLGASSILEAIRLLLECARCESLSPWANRDRGDDETTASDSGISDEEEDDELLGKDDTFGDDGSSANPQHTNAIQCRRDLAAQQIDDPARKWLARLVATRRIVAVPIADVAGFYQRLAQLDDDNEQTDQQSVEQSAVDPEYDFPIPLHASLEANACMSTFPARLMNELVRSHAFQLGLAFHGPSGDSLGHFEIPSWAPPGQTATLDQIAMEDVAHACGDFGLPHVPFPVRVSSAFASDGLRMPTFEHFAYAAGREMEGTGVNNAGSLLMDQCRCGAQDVCAYPSDRTGIYDGSSLRAFIGKVVAMREVPSSIDELPGFDPSYDPSNFYHNRHPLFERNRLGANVRMSLLTTALVQPWTAVRSIAGVAMKDDDIVPLSPRVPGGCTNTRRMRLPESSLMSNITVTWTVGGALSIDETAVMHGKWGVLDSKIFDCVSQPTKQELDTFFSIVRDFEFMEGETTSEMQDDVSFTPVQNGATRWHSSANDGADSPLSPERTFSATIDLSDYSVGNQITVYALARTDQSWISGEGPMAQTHVVNARTNPDWSLENGGAVVKGRLDWFSVPVTIEIGPQPGFFEGRKPVDVSVRASDEGFSQVDGPLGTIAYALLMAVVVVASTLFCVFCREKRDGTDVFSIWGEHRQIDKQKISMDEFFSDTELTMISMN